MNAKQPSIRAAAACIVVWALAGCSKTPAEMPAPPMAPEPVLPASAAGVSVPEASQVLAPAAAASTDPTAGRSNKPMTREQESTAMPMPGQNNDHSAPLSPAKPASTS